MSWQNILKEFRDSMELIKEMEEIVSDFESELGEIKSFIAMEKYVAEKKDFGIPYEEVLSEFKEEVESGMTGLKGNSLAKLLLEKLK